MSEQITPVPIEHLRVLRKAQVLALVGLSDTRIRVLERAGRFPKRIYLGDNSVGWLEVEVRAWLEERIANGRWKPSGCLAPVPPKPAKKAAKGARV